tara:strand:+ start:161 stop:874 length:714 start_codon:yes stop_codon:yes gene_type:complete
MGLPNLLNDVPRYDIKLPSASTEVKIRPFLVKEQKVLMIAAETKDPREIVKSMIDCVKSCVEGANVQELPTHDLDYAFLKIRSKSVGEKANIITKCQSCQADNSVSIDLEKIEFSEDKTNKDIKLSDKIILKMKQPTYSDMLKNEKLFTGDLTPTETLFETMFLCMDSVQNEDENIMLKDESREDLENFVNTFSNDQLQKVTDYIEGLPRVQHSQDYECASCSSKNTFSMRGVQDFF